MTSQSQPPTPENQAAARERQEEASSLQPIYVASRASLPERGQMWRDFRARGYPITSTWIDEDGEGATESWEDLWRRISNEIASSVALVLYAETDDFPLKGALLEAGMALGMNKPVIICLPKVSVDPRSYRPIGSWIKHPLVTRVDDIKSAVLMASAFQRHDLLQQPTTSERCVECLHELRYHDEEQCRALVLSPSVAGSGMAHCDCKCVYPATGADDGDGEQGELLHWRFRADVEETMCGLSVHSGAGAALLPEAATCPRCKAALVGYKFGRAFTALSPAPVAEGEPHG